MKVVVGCPACKWSSWSFVTYTRLHINYSCSGTDLNKGRAGRRSRLHVTKHLLFVTGSALFFICLCSVTRLLSWGNAALFKFWPGSDDAVPPHFSSNVLGSKDPGLDRGVTFRHAEGIYSKRLKAVTFKMQSPEHRGELNTHTDYY